MMIESALTVMRRMVAVALLGTFMTFAAASVVLIPAEPAHANIFDDVGDAFDDAGDAIGDAVDDAVAAATKLLNEIADAVGSIVNAIVGPVSSALTAIETTIVGVVNGAKSLVLDAVDVVLGIVEEIHGFLANFVTLIIGLDPNNLHSFVVANLNEDACRTLPDKVNNVGNALPAFPDLPLIGHLVSFADLQLNLPDVVGIDPVNADSDDLFLFKAQTDLPIATLAGMAEFPYTIPSGIVVAFSSFCVEATERHLANKEDIDKFRNQIHHDLTLGGKKHSANALNELPAAQGGSLEEVRSVVSETIAQLTADDEKLGKKPLRELDKGDTAFAEGSFREAYNHYQKAYSIATNSNRS